MDDVIQVPQHLVREFSEAFDEVAALKGKPGFYWARYKHVEWLWKTFPILKDRELDIDWSHAMHPQIRVGELCVPVAGQKGVEKVFKIPDEHMFKCCELQEAPPSHTSRYDMWKWLVDLTGWPSTTPMAIMGRYVIVHEKETSDPRGAAADESKDEEEGRDDSRNGLRDKLSELLASVTSRARQAPTKATDPAADELQDFKVAFGVAASLVGHIVNETGHFQGQWQDLVSVTRPLVGHTYALGMDGAATCLSTDDRAIAVALKKLMARF